MPIDPGNTLNTAFNFGNLSGTSNITWNEAIRNGDANDYYRFSLSNSSSFNITLNGLTADADLQLLSADGVVLESSVNSSNSPETIARSLTAGTYYIRVYPFQTANTPYTLQVRGNGASVDPGNTLATAYDLGTRSDRNQTYSESVSGTDLNDYYRIELAESRILSLGLNGLTADADLELLNTGGTVIASSDNGGTSSESLSRVLNAGVYYLRVFSYDRINTPYNLTISDALADGAGNTLATARTVTVGTTPLTLTDFVGSSDLDDYYRFTLSDSSYLNATLTGLSADVDFRLIRDVNNNGVVDAGDELASSIRSGFNDEAINRAGLAAGTYFVHVYRYSGDSDYTLRLSTSDPSNLLLNELSFSTPDVSLTGFVGNSDTSDLYRFSLTTAGVFSASISGLTADADIRLIRDANNNGIVDAGEEIARSQAAITTVDSLSRNLDAGTYFFQVYQFTGDTNYQLQVSLTPPDQAGNSLTDARLVSVGGTPATFTDFVGAQDTNDYYRFNLSTTSNFNLTLTGLEADADVELLNSTGGLIERSLRAGSNDELINRVLDSGTYYVRVYPFSSDTNYRLRLSATTNLSAASDLVAEEFTVSSATGTYTGQISSSNTSDLYQLDLTTTSSLSATLSGLNLTSPDDADLRLIRDANNNGIVDDGEEVARSNRGVGLSEVINQASLTAGTYYLQVFRFAGASPYTLNIQTNPFVGGTRFFNGSLGADTFSYTQGYSQLVFSGNGNVDFGSGSRDLLDLSTFNIASATFNYANTTSGGVVFNPGNGSRVFDSVTLTGGSQILFEGVERIRFADQTIDVFATGQLPNDPLFGQQWNLHMMGVHNAWRFTQGSNNVLIGVQDTGLGTTANGAIHPDLRTTTTLTDNYRDDFTQAGSTSHGTGVQGIIAATTNNGIGMSGINWNSQVYAIDVLGGDRNDQSLAQAAQTMINEARRLNQRLVINMSLAVPESFGLNYDTALAEVVRDNPNVLFVIAAGNYGNQGKAGISSPAFLASRYSNVMAVGASWGRVGQDGLTRTPGTRISYSQYGQGLTLMGPSEHLSTRSRLTTSGVQFDYSPATGNGSSNRAFDGTSAATPNVTGVASLVWSANPNLTAAQVRQILSETASDLGARGYDSLYGNGFVNADAAVRRAIALGRSA